MAIGKDYGFKVSKPSSDTSSNHNALDHVVHSSYPNLKCWLKPEPRHYGKLKINVNSPGLNRNVDLLTIKHGYNHIPSFMAAWYSPDGSGTRANAKFGTGTYEYFLSGQYTVYPRIDATNFYITLVTGASSAPTNKDVEFRYYIFADEYASGQFINAPLVE